MDPMDRTVALRADSGRERRIGEQAPSNAPEDRGRCTHDEQDADSIRKGEPCESLVELIIQLLETAEEPDNE